MNYLPDQPRIDYEGRRRAQQSRYVAMLLYALPFVLLPLVLGGLTLWRGLPSEQVRVMRDEAAALHGRMEEAEDLGELTALQARIERLEAAIAESESRRAQYIAARVWASGFCAIGLVLLAAWAVALVKLTRQRTLADPRWPPAQP